MTRPVLAFILALGFGLRFRAANHPYISQWDEAYHALVARNLAAHPLEPRLYEDKVLPSDDQDWTKAGVWLHKPPLPLWLMSASLGVFGEGELSLRLPSVVFDTLTILLVFLLGLELFGETAAGLYAAALYAVNPLMIRLVSGRIPDDAPHALNVFFITCTAYLFAVCARKNSRAVAALAGLSLGLGTLCMSAVALLGLAAPIPLMISYRGVRGACKILPFALVPFLAAALPWPLYARSRWPDLWRHESALQLQHLFTALDGHAHAWWWYLKILPVQYGWPSLVAWAAVLACAVHAARARMPGARAALLWVALPYLFFSLIATKLYAYVCVAVPGMALLLGLGAAALWRQGRVGRAAVAAALLAVALGRVRADYSIASWNFLYDYPAFRAATRSLRAVPGPKVILNVGDDKAPQAMYYSGAAAYADAPTPALVRGLLDRGYRVYVLLDEEHRGAGALQALKKAGLDKKIFFLPLPAPLGRDLKHPYEA